MANKALGKAAEKQRSRKIMKKFKEIQTTYGVKVCAIVYKPYPQGSVSEVEILKKIEEAKEKLKKQREKNRVKEITIRLNEMLKAGGVSKDLGINELREMDYVLSLVLKEIDYKLIKAKKAKESQSNAAAEGTKR